VDVPTSPSADEAMLDWLVNQHKPI